MALSSRMSIQGLYKFDPSIFEEFNVPEGMEKDVAINYILSECMDLEVIYPDAYAMKVAVAMWTTAELPIWERMWIDANLKYNPLWNVDGEEVRTIERHGVSSATGETSSVDKVMGYNVGEGWSDSAKVEGDAENHGTEDEIITDTFKRGGNIGVTMTTQLLNADLDLLPRFNIYKYICDSFKYRFTVEVY